MMVNKTTLTVAKSGPIRCGPVAVRGHVRQTWPGVPGCRVSARGRRPASRVGTLAAAAHRLQGVLHIHTFHTSTVHD